jgi:NADPH-dependent curcumin reductase
MVLSAALKPIDNVVDGFEKLPEAISELYQGSRAGKLQVRFEPDRIATRQGESRTCS